MSKRVYGKLLAIIGALAMIINISFFKQAELYDTVRWLSFAVFSIGILFIPQYSRSKNKD